MSEPYTLPGAKMPARTGTPWKMWGTSVNLDISATTIFDRTSRAEQVARIDYKRPENWRFWIGAKLLGGNTNTSGATLTATVIVDLFFGVGRDLFDTGQDLGVASALGTRGGFVEFVWDIPNGGTPGQTGNNTKYTTTALTPPLNDQDPTSVERIDHIVAQSISCRARAGYIGVAQFQVTAFFAPNVHVRPDWWLDEDGRAFAGAEIGGT